LPGDRVSFSIIKEDENTGFIESIEPRKTQLLRPAVANTNQLAIVIAAKSPEPDFLLLDKLLIMSKKEGIEPLICINKIDLDADRNYLKIIESYNETGYEIVAISSKTNTGMEEFKNRLSKRITVLAGQSGVGKSTILNKIIGYSVMKTGNISEKIERGKQTTRHAELFHLADRNDKLQYTQDTQDSLQDSFIVDTPGFSFVELEDITFEELQIYYPEMNKYHGECRFKTCTHVTEPGCKIKNAVNKSEFDHGRYERYVDLLNVLKEKKLF
jgi:ribosome biogenesis GTPase